MSRLINAIASFLSTSIGFVATFAALMVGVAIGWLLQFNDGFMFTFNLILSVTAIVISGVILVSAARSEAAIHVKLDYLIEVSRAANTAIGLEHKDVGEIEAERRKVEAHVAEIVDEAVEEEVTEQLDRRQLSRREPSAPAR